MSSWTDVIKGVAQALQPLAPAMGVGLGYVALQHGKDVKKLAAKILPSLGAVKKYTTDLTEQAKTAINQGAPFDRAFGREKEIRYLISLLLSESGGFAILVGPSGSGKSTIVKELAWRIANREEPSLEGHHILEMDATQTGNGGIMDLMTNLMSGGMSSVVEEIVRELETRYGKGQVYYLYFDEIQDFLKKNPAAFSNLKQDLAARGVHIIGASMNKEVVNKWIDTQEGMERRTNLIHVDSMSHTAMAEVLEKLGLALTERAQKKHPHLTISINASAIGASIFLASQLEPTHIDPARSVKFFSAFVASSINEHLKKTPPKEENKPQQPINLTFTEEDVFAYLTFISDIEEIQVATLKLNYENQSKTSTLCSPNSSQSVTLDEHFQLIEPHQGKGTSKIKAEANSLSAILMESEDPVVVYKSSSASYIRTIVEYTQSLIGTEGKSFVRCSLKELMRKCRQNGTNADNFQRQLELTLRKLMASTGKFVYIEDGEQLIPHLDCLRNESAFLSSPAKDPESTFSGASLANQFTPLLSSFTTQLGGLGATPTKPKDFAASQALILDKISQAFITEINENRIRVVIARTNSDSSGKDLNNEIHIAPPDQEVKEWIKNLLPIEINTSDAEKIVEQIWKIVDAFNLLGNKATSRAEVCHLLLQQWLHYASQQANKHSNSILNHTDPAPWVNAVFSLDRFSRNRDEITHKIISLQSQPSTPTPLSHITPPSPIEAVVNWEMDFSYLRQNIPSDFENNMANFKNQPKDLKAPLRVLEDSHATREFRNAQMAAWLKERSHRVISYTSSDPKLPIINRTENGIPPVIFAQGHELAKQFDYLDQAMENGYKLAIFSQSPDLPSPTSSFPMANMFQALANFTPALTPNEPNKEQTPTAAATNKWPKLTTYQSPELSEEEKPLFLRFQIDTAMPKGSRLEPSVIKDFSNAYQFLWNDRSWVPDTITDEVRKDIPSLKTVLKKEYNNINQDDVIDYFVQKPNLGKTRSREIVYAINLSRSPYWYRAYRLIRDPVIHAFKGLLSMVKKAFSMLTTPLGSLLTSFFGPLGRMFQAISLFRKTT